MKKIFKLLGICLSVVLMGAASACTPEDINETDDSVLGIKAVFPTKVVAGQPMTISGSCLSDVTEIVFPDNISVTTMEHVGKGMIRVIAPAGISADGGKIIVKSSTGEAESKEEITLGDTKVTGYSKEPGEKITGGNQLTIFGTDLEFIVAVELVDADGEPLLISHENFFRKGTSSVIITIPTLNIFTGTIVGKIYTYDGKVIEMPEFEFEPGSKGGHWEINKETIWENDGTVAAASWGSGSPYRFALEGRDGNKEAVAEIPADLWERMKTETFYMNFTGDAAIIRVVTGWWSDQFKVGADSDGDFRVASEAVTKNEDGSYTLALNLKDSDLAAAMDEKHFLYAGDGFTVNKMYFIETVEAPTTPAVIKVWENDGTVAEASWSGSPYRFALEGTGGTDALAEIAPEHWNAMKTKTFYATFTGDDAQIRVVTGWWTEQYKVGADSDGDFRVGSPAVTEAGGGKYTIEINLEGQDMLSTMDEKHFLFAGNGFTILDIYYK